MDKYIKMNETRMHGSISSLIAFIREGMKSAGKSKIPDRYFIRIRIARRVFKYFKGKRNHES